MTWEDEQWLHPEGGACRASLGMASPRTGVIDLVAVTNPQGSLLGDRRVAAWRFDQAWSEPTYLAGRVRDTAPFAISRQHDITDVFAIGAAEDDGALLSWWNVAGTWGGPSRLPGPRGLLSRAAPAAAAWHDNRLDVFGVSNPDGLLGPRRLVHWWWEGSGWSQPELIESRLRDVSPAVIAPENGRLGVYAVGADDLDGQVVTFWWPHEGRWGGPWPLPGQRRGLIGSGGPAAVSINPRRVDVFAVTTDGNLAHWWYQDGWHGPETIELKAAKLDPAARPCIVHQRGANHFDLFVPRAPELFLSRDVVHWTFTDILRLQPVPVLGNVNELGVVAARGQEDVLHVASGRDDGKIAYTRTYRRLVSPRLSATADASGHLRLDWTLPARTARVEVWARGRGAPDLPDHKIAEVNPPNHTFEHAGIQRGVRYCYFVRAYDEFGIFGESAVTCAQINP